MRIDAIPSWNKGSLGCLLAAVLGPFAYNRAHGEVGRQRYAANVGAVDEQNGSGSDQCAFLPSREMLNKLGKTHAQRNARMQTRNAQTDDEATRARA
jgi:hypothetical protein